MASVAHDGDFTIAPFRRISYIRESALLTNTLFAIPDNQADLVPQADSKAVMPQVIPMPDRARFEEAVTCWLRDIRLDSFSADMKEHDSFNEIVSQGYGVVPLIAAHLRRRPSFLFLALEEIIGEDPVPEDAYGKLNTVVAAWLEWLQR